MLSCAVVLAAAMSEPRSAPLRPRRLGATYAVPTWMPEAALEVNEPSAVLALGRIRKGAVRVPSIGADVGTTYWRTDKFARAGSPTLVFLHGADSNCLEWRYVAEKLGAARLDCLALDWWSGGFTERAPITAALAGGGREPWTLVRDHLHAFFEQALFGDDVGDNDGVVLVGASLGGAVAIDYAAAHPERVRGLVLIDAGGESYAAPSAAAVKALAPGVLAVKALAAWASSLLDTSEDGRIAGLHRKEPGWREAYGAYLASGGYQAAVTPALIRTLRTPTLVVWGEDDPVLPLADAFAFEADLGDACRGVRVVSGTGHCPHLEDPEPVAKYVAAFLEELGLVPDATNGDDGVSRRTQFRDTRPPIG